MTLSDVFQEAKTIVILVILVVCLPKPAIGAQVPPPHGIGRPPFEEPYGFSGVHTEEHGC
jgi:hypothetical protein